MAARYTDDRRENFDIYLPQWLAKHDKLFGTLYLASVIFSFAQVGCKSVSSLAFRGEEALWAVRTQLTIASNHIHLLVRDTAPGVIAQSIQLIAGRTGRDYNQRKARKGAYWEDRYHATAVEADEHLRRCLVYIDLNMVRAGVVKHPAHWAHGGYREIQAPPKRYAIIDLGVLTNLSGCATITELQKAHREWVEDALCAGIGGRDERWSDSLAVGSQAYLDKIKAALGPRATHRQIAEADGMHTLREPTVSYTPRFEGKSSALRPRNTYFWNEGFYSTNA